MADVLAQHAAYDDVVSGPSAFDSSPAAGAAAST
jgi:hypothetical protein